MADNRIELDTALGGAIAIAAPGDASAATMRAFAQKVWGTQGFEGCYLLWDLRGVRFDLSADEVRGLADFAADNSPLRNGSRMAFVLAGSLEYGLARMLGTMRARQGIEVGAYRDLEEALRWVQQAPAAESFRQG